jgi:acyl-CoA thioester hydrolase
LQRIKITIPPVFSFRVTIPVRITDVNYGGHVGNDSVLSIMHEARMQFLKHHGYSELDFGGTGLIMSDVGIEFRNELFYGDSIIASVSAGDFSKVSFDLYYKFEKPAGDKLVLIAIAKTGMICYNYDQKKISVVPEDAKTKISSI